MLYVAPITRVTSLLLHKSAKDECNNNDIHRLQLVCVPVQYGSERKFVDSKSSSGLSSSH